MGLTNFEQALTDINGNLVGVSGSMALPIGAIGQLAAGVNGATGLVEYISTSLGAQVITGSVAITTPISVTFPSELNIANFPAVQAVSASSPSGFWFSGGVAVSGTVGVNNFPATQNVSGTVTVGGQVSVNNFPAVQAVSGTVAITTAGPLQVWTEGAFGVSASVQLPVYNTGPVGVSGTVTVGGQVSVDNFPAVQAVSGTVGAVINNWPATIGISASAGQLPVYMTGPVGVSGTVAVTTTGPLQVWTEGAFGVSGTVGVNNFPATQNVSGTVTAIIGNWPATIGVSSSATLNVAQQGQVSVNNFPATQNVSGTVSVQGGAAGTVAPVQIWSEGPIGVTGSFSLGSQIGVNNFPAVQAVSGTVTSIIGNWPATIGISASAGQLPVYMTGPVGVSGTVTIAQPLEVWVLQTVGVSGAYGAGTTPAGTIYPVMEGGVDPTGKVHTLLTDPLGRLTNPTTGSNVTTIAATTGNVTVLYPNPNRAGGIIFNEGSATMFAKFGQTASQTSYTVQIAAKGYYEIPFTYQGQIDATFSTNTGNARITELT